MDQPFAQGLLQDFTQRTGIRVQAVFDTEAGKTTGLARRLFQERSHPRCDVWWSGEVFATIQLAEAGMLEAYSPATAADIPSEWKDPQGRWTGCAARARVLAYHTRRARPEKPPETWNEIAGWPRERLARFALANPQFGTTRGHVAALFAYWGEASATDFLRRLHESGAPLADGNSHAVRMLESGAADWCMTDTDDVWVAQARGAPIDLCYPGIDRETPALWIPCTVALVAGAPNPAGGRSLVDFLASAEAERALAASNSRNVPVRAETRRSLSPAPDPEPVAVDYQRVSGQVDAAMRAVRELLLR